MIDIQNQHGLRNRDMFYDCLINLPTRINNVIVESDSIPDDLYEQYYEDADWIAICIEDRWELYSEPERENLKKSLGRG